MSAYPDFDPIDLLVADPCEADAKAGEVREWRRRVEVDADVLGLDVVARLLEAFNAIANPTPGMFVPQGTVKSAWRLVNNMAAAASGIVGGGPPDIPLCRV